MDIGSLKILRYACFGSALYFATYIGLCSAIWDMRDVVTEEAMISHEFASFFMIVASLVVETIIAKQIKKKKAKEETVKEPEENSLPKF